MKAIKWVGWCGVGLLVASCMWTTGCGGGDGDGDTTVVVTNTTTVVTNAPATAVLVAPQLINPEDNKSMSIILLPGNKYTVNFEWTGVPGAQSYVLEVNGNQNPISGTTAALQFGNLGTYTWRVWAKDANGAGPASSKFKFILKKFIAVPLPSP